MLIDERDGYGWQIPMLALWANLHGGFIMGIAALGAYAAVSGLQDVIAGRGYNRAIRLAAITGTATLATLVTPYGLGTWYASGTRWRSFYTERNCGVAATRIRCARSLAAASVSD